MLQALKRLFPARTRAAMRVVWWLSRNNRPLLVRVFRRVATNSLIDILASFEDEGGDAEGYMCITLRKSSRTLILRRRSSDFNVFRELILNNQYLMPVPEPVEFVIDAGANIGLASVWFLEHYPKARLLSIEPDPENFAIASKNLSSYGSRCTLINAALWHQNESVSISRGTFRDGREWATQTIPVTESSEFVVEAKTLASLLEEYQYPRIDLLKIDIEGAELNVFRDGDTEFLNRTKCCAVECHGIECSQAFEDATVGNGFTLSKSGELTIALRSN